MRFWIRYFTLALTLWLSTGGSAAPHATGDALPRGEVRVGSRSAFVIQSGVAGISAAERADIINRRIERVLRDETFDPRLIQAGTLPDGSPGVMLGDLVLTGVSRGDAAAAGNTQLELAIAWARILRTEITQIQPLYLRQGKVDIKTLSEHHVLLLVLQVALLLLVATACGELMSRLGQPVVIGQLLAGVLLGQSFFGALVPGVQALIFPVETTQSYLLEVVSWIGVIFLLMLTGMETDLALIRQQGKPVLWTALTGIVVPFVLGAGVGYLLPVELLTTPEERTVLALFLGTALSISSVPVIANILMDMKLMRRDIGQTILASALAHDTAGWIILAVVAGLASSGTFDALVIGKALIGTLLFLAFSFTLGRRWSLGFLRYVHNSVRVPQATLTAVVVLTLLSAGITQFIGVHAVLGAFIVGVVLSTSPLIGEKVTHPIEVVTMAIFAPIFFAAAGLHVNLSVLLNPSLLLITAIFTGAACAGKIGGCYVGGRWGGMSGWAALSLGIGTNARGAMGLIIAILGFSLGILTIDMYSIIIIMALLTTAMTPSLLRWSLSRVQPSPTEEARLQREAQQSGSFLSRARRVLLPTDGGPDAQLAAQLLNEVGQNYEVEVTALHVQDSTAATSNGNAKAAFDGVSNVLSEGPISLLTRTVQAPHPAAGIVEEAARDYNLIVMGCERGKTSADAVFGRVTDKVAHDTACPMLIVRSAQQPVEWPVRHILLPVSGRPHNAQTNELAIALARATGARITALYVVGETPESLFWHAQQHEQSEELGRESIEQVTGFGEPFGVPVEGRITTAPHAGPEIVRVASEVGADLILLSGHSRSKQRLFFGSTIAYVLNHAEIAVAVLKPG